MNANTTPTKTAVANIVIVKVFLISSSGPISAAIAMASYVIYLLGDLSAA